MVAKYCRFGQSTRVFAEFLLEMAFAKTSPVAVRRTTLLEYGTIG
jgi:hypothetical protein